MTLRRREFLKWSAASAGVGALAGCAGSGSGPSVGHVVVIGGGFGGATVAKYLRKWSPDIAVTLVEREGEFKSCPISNLILGGTKTLADVTVSYDALPRKYGVRMVRDDAVGVDPVKQEVRLRGGATLRYDRLVLSPGIDFSYDAIPGLKAPAAQAEILHAWKPGTQTVSLRRQLEAVPDGGVYALHIPLAPYRCPPGPYERACQVAWYFRQAKPKSKVIILDSNPDVTSKAGLFKAAWSGIYKGIVEYRPNSELLDVDAGTRTAKLLGGDVKASVLNVVPPQRAGDIAQAADVVTANNRWCEVDWRSMESIRHRNIHVLGDATLSAPLMPKSGHMANNHGKIAAAAIIQAMHGRQPDQEPVIANTCYSFITDRQVVHVASVHRYDADKKTLVTVPGSGGLSTAPNDLEGQYAMVWAANIWADMLG
jgi:sulfite dehydrogenase